MFIGYLSAGIVVAIVASWVYGEYSNSRTLRLTAILVPTLVAIPSSFLFGYWFAEQDAYVECRKRTCDLLRTTVIALDKGDASNVEKWLNWLLMQNDNVDKHAGLFFFSNMVSARKEISKPLSDKAPASTVQDAPQ